MAKPIDRGHKHTNSSLRKLLGEAGYLEEKDGAIIQGEQTHTTMWRRGSDRIWLIESKTNNEPYLTERGSAERIDPRRLGVRNPNIQTGEKP